MATLVRVYVFWILIYIWLFTEGSGYFISSTATTWQTFGKECELVQPELKYNEKGLVELKEQFDIHDPIPQEGVWIGYFKAFTKFEFKGCGIYVLTYPNKTHTVSSLAQCHHICRGTNMWIIGKDQIKKCVCTNVWIGLIYDGCTLCDDIICGSGFYNAVYSVLTDATVESRDSNNTDYVCQASQPSFNQSAWVMCTDKRNVWCNDDGRRYISTQTFANWNAANDHCANANDYPSSAANNSEKTNIPNLAFTNIRREWTLHTAKSSFNGPRMFAYITIGSTEIQFSNSSEDRKYFLCVGTRPTTTTTASTTQASSPKPSSVSPTTTIPSTSTSSAPSSATNTTTANITVSTSSMFTYSTTGNTSTSSEPNETFAEASRGSSTAATAAGVSVAVALAVAAVLIVVGLRKKGKLCFAISKGSTFESTDNNRDISLARIDSKPNASYPASTQNGSFPDPLSNPTYCEHHTKTRTSKELCTSADADVDNENTNGKLGLAESEVHSYFVLEKDGFEQQRQAITSVPTDFHDYFVLEKQQSAIGNENSGPKNELHANFVHAKQGRRSAHEMPSNEAYPYFVLEKQTTLNSTPINTAFSRDLAKDDTDIYQEIDSNDTYAAIDDSRDDNNDYDYTNKAFKHSRTDFSDNIYNHLNTACDDYDHVGKVHNKL